MTRTALVIFDAHQAISGIVLMIEHGNKRSGINMEMFPKAVYNDALKATLTVDLPLSR